MNKSAKTAIIVAVVLIIFIILAIIIIKGVVIPNINKEKTALSAEEFKTSMSEKGYTVVNANNQFLNYDYVKQVYVAFNANENYQIEFYELSDENYAQSFFNNNKNIFESSKESTNAETSTSGKNYVKYTLSSNSKYMVVSRINNTVIYVNVDDTHRDAIKAALKEIGY